MRIKQIGNGGAFDFDSTSSSFLIEFEEFEKMIEFYNTKLEE